MARPKPVSEEARQALARRQAALTALTLHPSWEDLKDEVRLKRARIEKTMLAKMFPQMRPSDPIAPVDQAELFYMRGLIAGMEWLVAQPEGAESRLTEFLEARGVKTEERV